MKPAPFAWEAPRSLDAAIEALGRHGDEAKLLAGGQSLIPVMNFRLARPAVLVDLNGLPDLDFVHPGEDGVLRIGALARQSRVERDPSVRQLAPLLAEAMPWIAHPQIRNRGTIGGTLAHADPAAELPAVAVALGARLRLDGPRGERWVGADDFFHGLFATDLRPDEILTEIEIPAAEERTGTAFLEIARRHGDYALAGVAAVITLDASGSCSDARIVLMSVGDRPLVAGRAADLLVGERPGEVAIEAASDTVRGEIDPAGDIHASADFKRHLAGVLTRRALAIACDRARNGGAPA